MIFIEQGGGLTRWFFLPEGAFCLRGVLARGGFLQEGFFLQEGGFCLRWFWSEGGGVCPDGGFVLFPWQTLPNLRNASPQELKKSNFFEHKNSASIFFHFLWVDFSVQFFSKYKNIPRSRFSLAEIAILFLFCMEFGQITFILSHQSKKMRRNFLRTEIPQMTRDAKIFFSKNEINWGSKMQILRAI